MECSVKTFHEGKMTQSEPIIIPNGNNNNSVSRDGDNSPRGVARNQHVMRFLSDEEHVHSEKGSNTQASYSPHSDEEFNPIPDGSPTFSSVLAQLSINNTRPDLVKDGPTTPISPLAVNEPYKFDTEKPEVKTSGSVPSPIVLHKRVNSATTLNNPRSRSYSWSYRKHVTLNVPQNSPSSVHSSPLIIRKPNKSKLANAPSKLIHVIPKYKFLSETISVSHEDLVKEQERERQLAEGFAESKSIFHTPTFDRLGGTPE